MSNKRLRPSTVLAIMKLQRLTSTMIAACVIFGGGITFNAISLFTPLTEEARAVACNWSSSRPLPWEVNVRADKTSGSALIGKKPPGVILNFEAWEDGQAVKDAWDGKMDTKWFKLRGEPGWVASAVIPGYPPNNCQVPPPNRETPFLPFDSGVTLPVTQGYATSLINGSHATLYPTLNRYAVDFGAGGKGRVGARASRYGQVVYAGSKTGGYGNVVVVRYSDGKHGRYLHLNEIWVRQNDWVAGGQGLGLIGQTGNADGIHLHYAESWSPFGDCIPLPQFADAPDANFNKYGFNLTSKNPDGRR